MLRRIGAALLVLTALLASLASSALAVAVEQVQTQFPKIDVYVYEDGTDFSALAASDVSAALDGKSVTVESFAPSDEGIFYIFLLDISGSIPAAHFNAVKQAILTMRGGMRAQDRLAVIAFGDKVRTLLTGGESLKAVSAALDPLVCTDKTTAFYDAMNAAADLVLKTGNERCVAVVVSDGINTASGGMTQEQLETKLRQNGVAVNALCVDTAKPADVQKFTDFIHASGGELYSFGGNNAGTVLSDLTGRLNEGWVLGLDASGCTGTGTAQLHVNFGKLASVDADVSLPAAQTATAATAASVTEPPAAQLSQPAQTSAPATEPEVSLPMPETETVREEPPSLLADFSVILIMGAVLIVLLTAVFLILYRIRRKSAEPKHEKVKKEKKEKKKPPKGPKGGPGVHFIFTDPS